jgi:hypothetical protein
MKQYIVLTRDYNLRGIIPTKRMKGLFQKQRNPGDYVIESTKNKQWIDMLHSDGRNTEEVYGYILFNDEHNYLMENFETYLKDLDWLVLALFSTIEPVLKLEGEERKLINDFVEMVVLHLKGYREEFAEDFQTKDVPKTEDKFFRMEKIIEPVLGIFDL